MTYLRIYFNNGRHIECLSLTYATNKSKTPPKRRITLYKIKNKKNKKKWNIQGNIKS